MQLLHALLRTDVNCECTTSVIMTDLRLSSHRAVSIPIFSFTLQSIVQISSGPTRPPVQLTPRALSCNKLDGHETDHLVRRWRTRGVHLHSLHVFSA